MEKFFVQTGHDSVECDSDNPNQLFFINSTNLTNTTMPMISEDIIHLRNLRLSAVIGMDAWNRPNQSQPIILSLQLYIDTTPAGNSDDIKDTFSYGQMCKDVIRKVDGKSFKSIDHLTWSLGELFNDWPGTLLKIQALAPKSILRVEGGLTKECVWRRETGNSFSTHAWAITGLKIACIIGVNPHERLQKQIVNINLRIVGATDQAAYRRQVVESHGTWGPLVKRICEVSGEFGATSKCAIMYLTFTYSSISRSWNLPRAKL